MGVKQGVKRTHGSRGTGNEGFTGRTVGGDPPALLLLFAGMLDTVTERRLSGRRAGVAGGESWLRALAIMRVAAEKEKQKDYLFLSVTLLIFHEILHVCTWEGIRGKLGFTRPQKWVKLFKHAKITKTMCCCYSYCECHN